MVIEQETKHEDRALTISSAENVRDLGGYSINTGGQTKWGRFVRSGDMDHLTESDQQKLIAYGIKTVIDLRMEKEIASLPNVFADSQKVNFLIHDFWGDRFDTYRSTSKGAPAEVKLADLYCSGLLKSGFVMHEIMATIADSHENGFAFHCRSGKDRTGLVAMMLLSIAGVDKEIIVADFALTSTYLTTPESDPNQPGFYLKGCKPETMQRTLAFLDEKFSGVLGYLDHIGVSEQQIKRIRQKLIE